MERRKGPNTIFNQVHHRQLVGHCVAGKGSLQGFGWSKNPFHELSAQCELYGPFFRVTIWLSTVRTRQFLRYPKTRFWTHQVAVTPICSPSHGYAASCGSAWNTCSCGKRSLATFNITISIPVDGLEWWDFPWVNYLSTGKASISGRCSIPAKLRSFPTQGPGHISIVFHDLVSRRPSFVWVIRGKAEENDRIKFGERWRHKGSK